MRATCPKGHSLTLEDRLAGKKIRCPRCQSVFQVPEPDDEYEEDEYEEDEEEEDRPRLRGRQIREAVTEKPLQRPRPRDEDEEEEDEDERPRGRARRAVEDDDEDDEEEEMDDATRRKMEKRLKKKQLKLVDVGLLLHLIRLWMYIIGILLGITVAILLAIAGSQAAEAVAEKQAAPAGGGAVGFVVFGTVTILALLLFLLQLVISQIAPLLGIVGSFLCCWVPKKSESRGTIIMSLTFDLVSMVAGLLVFLGAFNVLGMDETKRENMILYLRYISFFCTSAAWLTFLTFLRGLGRYIGEPGVGNEALNLIARLVVMIITLIIDVVLIVAVGRLFLGVILAIFVAIGAMVGWFIAFVFTFYVRQLKLVSAMRAAVQNRM